MPRLVYEMMVSLDGFIEGRDPNLDWGIIDEELHRFANEEAYLAGANLASSLIRAGLVDEYRPIVHPVALGGGKPYLPPLDSPLNLRLLETRQFGSGVMYLRYSDGI